MGGGQSSQINQNNLFNEFLTGVQYFNQISVIEWQRINQIRTIGNGRIGEVWEISFPGPSQHFSMKIISVSPNDETRIKDIIEEIKLLQSCHHPNILPFYGISVSQAPNIYKVGIITPLKWGSLYDLLYCIQNNQRERLPTQFTNEVKHKMIFGITAALFYLANKKIIHRNLKPHNILLDENLTPFLFDFDISKHDIEDQGLWTTDTRKET